MNHAGRLTRRAAGLASATLLAVACGGDSASTTTTTTAGNSPTSSFSRIQSSIIGPSCAVSGCHLPATAAASGNLDMSAELAYDNLVNKTPTNLAALRDGLRRIVPWKRW